MAEQGPVIVVGVDGSEGAERATRWCAEIAPKLDARVVAVHAVSVPVAMLPVYEVPSVPVLDENWLGELEQTVARDWCAPLQEVDHRSEVVEGSPSHVLIERASELDAAMIVIGSRGRGGFTELLLGSVSHQVAHHAIRPVVIIPPPER